MNSRLLSQFFLGFVLLNAFCCKTGEDVTATSKRNSSFAKQARYFTWNEHRNELSQDGTQQVGLAVYDETNVKYRRNDSLLMRVHIGKPIKVFEAKEDHGWGFVQFPRIQRVENGEIAVRWNLTKDEYSSHPKYGWKYSNDNGKTWRFNWKNRPSSPGIEIPNGDKIYIYRKKIPENKVNGLSNIPYLINDFSGRYSSYKFYAKRDLPNALTGFYLTRLKSGASEYASEFSPIENDSNGIVTLQEGTFNIKGWGDMRVAKDNSIVKMVYGAFQQTRSGRISLKSPSFYRSTTNGDTWEFIGKVPFLKDDFVNNGDGQIPVGLDEAAFEILDSGKYVCVMRSSNGANTTPMYISFSNDYGKTWSRPKPFTNNGVLPQLQQLENKVLVLSSGRDGVQLRFNIEGDGITWSDPFEIVRHKGISGQVSCGYTGILQTGENRFLLVYSDFKNKNAQGDIRKAIVVREIIVEKL